MKKNKFFKLTVPIMIAALLFICPLMVSATSTEADMSITEEPSVSMMSKKSSSHGDLGQCIAVGAIVGIVVGGFGVLAVYLRYKNNGKSEPYPYENKSMLDLKISNDILIDTHVSRVKINKN